MVSSEDGRRCVKHRALIACTFFLGIVTTVDDIGGTFMHRSCKMLSSNATRFRIPDAI